jgi:hypothetical protein
MQFEKDDFWKPFAETVKARYPTADYFTGRKLADIDKTITGVAPQEIPTDC